MAFPRSLIPLLLLILTACQDSKVPILPTNPFPESTSALRTMTSPVKVSSSTALPQTPKATPSITPIPILTPDFPAQYYIDNIRGHKQFFPIGCETSTAVDWAAFYGTMINEFEFQYRLPLSDNPEIGFVGVVEGPWGQVPPYSYGVHAGPIADLLEKYGMSARSVKEMSLEELKVQVSGDNPVITWVIGNVVGGIPYEYTDSQGNKVIVAAYENTVIVTGYTEEKIRYMNNGKFYETPTDVFLNSWGILGNLAVVNKKR
jgi:uncharacterized protein YvpB